MEIISLSGSIKFYVAVFLVVVYMISLIAYPTFDHH